MPKKARRHFDISKIHYRVLSPLHDLPTIGVMGYLLLRDSWGWKYAKYVDPVEEIVKAEFILTAFDGPRLVGCAAVNRFGDPTPGAKKNGHLWFTCWYVDPEYRERGIGRVLYQRCMRYMDSQPYERGYYLSTENGKINEVLLRYDWIIVHGSTNESGARTKIYFWGRGGL